MVPIDNGGYVSGMHEVAYKNLLKYLGLEEEIVLSDAVQRLANVSDKVLELLGVDTRYLYVNGPSGWQYKEDDENGLWEDEWKVVRKRCGYYCDSLVHPLEKATLEDLKSYKFPNPNDSSRYKGLKQKARTLFKNSNYALVGGSIQALYCPAWDLRGYEQFMYDTAAEPEFANYLLNKILDWNMAFYDNYLNEIGEYIEFLWIGDDWGSQSGPLINPVEFRTNVVPRFKRLIDFIKSKTKAKIAYHSCGSVYWAMQDFVDMGVDILHPLQPNASEMGDSGKIKVNFGGKLSFHGGTNNQGLFHGEKEFIIEDAKQKIRYFAPGGGYIFSSGHNIQANCPPENIIALFQTAKKFGKYPIL
jgi:uroporphyrinogen decarboxylase